MTAEFFCGLALGSSLGVLISALWVSFVVIWTRDEPRVFFLWPARTRSPGPILGP